MAQVFAEGFRLIAGGVVSGIAGAIVLSRVLQSFHFEGSTTTDPVTLAGVGLLFAAVALAGVLGVGEQSLKAWTRSRR